MSADVRNQVRLLVNGSEYGGWKSARISAGIERQARDFDLTVTDRWPGQDGARRVKCGDACQVYVGPDLVLTGYVDATPIRYGAKSISVSVRGRSKTADLVDCCPIEAGAPVNQAAAAWGDVIGSDRSAARVVVPPGTSAGQWRRQKLEKIASAMAAPYSVRVVAEVDTGAAIPEHQVQVGESVFESIDRMMRLRHVLSTDNERGDLVLIEAGSAGRAGTALEVGKNVEAGSADLDFKGVFTQYIVKGQRTGTDDSFAADASEEEGEASDDTDSTGETASATDVRLNRRRVLVIKQYGQSDTGTCQDRADYERAYRAAQALQANYTVNGWRQADGSLWRPNQVVRVRDPIIGFDTDMLVAEVSLVLDEQGMRSEIRVGPKDGYVTKAGKLKKSQKGGGPDWSDVK